MIERFAFVKLASEHATKEGRRALGREALAVLFPTPGSAQIALGDTRTQNMGRWRLELRTR